MADFCTQPLRRRAFLKHGLLGACGVTAMGGAYASRSFWSEMFAASRPLTIVLITLDTTRADHLGCYHYPRGTSPHLDQLAGESMVYERAISPATWTLPAHASLFTGKFAASHGVCKSIDGSLNLIVPAYGPDDVNHYRTRPLAENEKTLASLLADAGYSTAAVVAGPWLKHVFGMNKGFDVYDDEHIEMINARRAEEVTDRALALLMPLPRQPQFLFLNYFDAHFPYEPPSEFARKFAQAGIAPPSAAPLPYSVERTRRLYDGEIHYMDHHLGRFLDGLRQMELYDDAWIIVTADHGEMLGEHDAFGHPGVVYQEAIHIPLIVKAPRSLRLIGRSDRWVQLVDVFPLLLSAAHLEAPAGTQGQVPPNIRHPIIVESRTLPGINSGGDWFAIIDEGWKFVWSSEGQHMLFNLNGDPHERDNSFSRHPVRARALGDKLHEYLAALPSPGVQSTSRIDAKLEAQLQSLGYVR